MAALCYAVNNQYIYTYPHNDVSGQGYNWWEPSTAVGSTWVHSFAQLGAPTDSYSAGWNGAWQRSSPIRAPDGFGGFKSVGDVFLAYDSSRSRYVLVGTSFEEFSSSLYFPTSTDGINWGALQEVLSGPPQGGAFDYGSVAVDSTGRIIVGAVKYYDNQQTSYANGFWIRTSTDGGANWSSYYEVAPPQPSDQRWGINSRVVAAGNHFLVFTPSLNAGAQFRPYAVSYYYEDSGTWSAPTLLFSFSSPLSNSPGTYLGYYIFWR